LYLRPACQSFVFYYTVAVLCGSLLFLVALCQHLIKRLLLYTTTTTTTTTIIIIIINIIIIIIILLLLLLL